MTVLKSASRNPQADAICGRVIGHSTSISGLTLHPTRSATPHHDLQAQGLPLRNQKNIPDPWGHLRCPGMRYTDDCELRVLTRPTWGVSRARDGKLVQQSSRGVRWTGRMGSVPPLLSFPQTIAAGWVQRQQAIVIEFRQAGNRLLKDRRRGKPIRFTDVERALSDEKSQGSGTRGAARTEHGRFCGYAAALAATADRRNMEFRAPARVGAARDYAEDLRSDCAHRPGPSGSCSLSTRA